MNISGEIFMTFKNIYLLLTLNIVAINMQPVNQSTTQERFQDSVDHALSTNSLQNVFDAIDEFYSDDNDKTIYVNNLLNHLISKGEKEQAVATLNHFHLNLNESLRLHQASRNNDTNAIHTLLKMKAHINYKDNEGNTPLHIAVRNQHTQATQAFIRAGAKINIPNYRGDTPLHIAAQKANLQNIQNLIDAGAKLNIINPRGDTPLHNAVRNQNTEAIQAFIRADAKLNIPNRRGNTPLHIAVQKADLQSAQDLVNAGADITIKNKEQLTPLETAELFSIDPANEDKKENLQAIAELLKSKITKQEPHKIVME
jgi:ankyrin repeat protein